MTEAPDAKPAQKKAQKKPAGLNGMLIAELKAMANALAIPGANSMKKADLVAAIQGAGTPKGEAAPARERAPKAADAPKADATAKAETANAQPADGQGSDGPSSDGPSSDGPSNDGLSNDGEQAPGRNRRNRNRNRNTDDQADKTAEAPAADAQSASRDADAGDDKPAQQPEQGNQQRQQNQRQQGNQQRQQNQQQGNQQGQNQQNPQGEDGEGGNRRRRGRERDRSARGRNEPDTTILEDDVLVPAAGILDVLDNYAFVRTSGYLPGADDVYVSLSLVRKLGLRRGDAIVGQVRQPREGERKEKFNPMVRIDSVNGVDPETAKDRVVFDKLTPLHPTERLRIATDKENALGTAIDAAAPVGKGQRGLIVSPPKAGKTTVLQTMSSAITTNNPECHLMVVLIDERPEEVTDFQRSVKGEVIASTFDRPASDHTIVAELAIERAKRLVELGHDVVVLLDGITRLSRAYNLAIPPSGRLLAGGVDAAALYPPKKFFGAARNIENGGSLTILATALVESGSKTDEVILEEFAGTANMELRLRREVEESGTFPSVDIAASGTRHRELLQQA